MEIQVTPSETQALQVSEHSYIAGKYHALIHVLVDGSQQESLIDFPAAMDLQISLDKNQMTISGPPPWVTVTGVIQSKGGFSLEGIGEVAGKKDVVVTLVGRFESSYGRIGFGGQYQIGLPAGKTISYAVQAQKDE